MTDNHALVSELQKLNRLLQGALPAAAPLPDFDGGLAFRWRAHPHGGWLETVTDLSPIRLDDLQGIDRQKAEIRRNTEQFVQGHSANNVLLTGSRGTGKSSLVKALINEFGSQGLRVVEVDKGLLHELPDIVALLRTRDERFIIYCDDLSFNDDDASYRALKTTLDGSLHAGSDNVLIYATSNRRHLLPEYQHENAMAHVGENNELHPGEAVEDKISLSDRFGMWLTFYPGSQDDYLAAARHWLGVHRMEFTEAARAAALQWALLRGNRSGRTASQFARDWAGRHGLVQSS
ncbi:MAG: ATP-binding protein [Moraxellaceae bacterium]|nr:ATP-binding protein [Moraxellaceae bacterium]